MTDKETSISLSVSHLFGISQLPRLPAHGQTDRERREHIIALWNDLKFRSFAKIAIDYYLPITLISEVGVYPKRTMAQADAFRSIGWSGSGR
jgi:hypothetical protein